MLKDELPVTGSARPVHHPLRLVAGIIKLVNPQGMGHSAPNSLIFIRVYIPRQRDDQAEAWLLRRMLMGGVDRSCIPIEYAPIVPKGVVGIIGVKAKNGSEADA